MQEWTSRVWFRWRSKVPHRRFVLGGVDWQAGSPQVHPPITTPPFAAVVLALLLTLQTSVAYYIHHIPFAQR